MANPDLAEVQMDTVIGTKGGKCLLTIHFVESSLMLAFLRDANTSQSVIDIINGLDQVLGEELFSKLFPYILTDSGSESLIQKQSSTVNSKNATHLRELAFIIVMQAALIKRGLAKSIMN